MSTNNFLYFENTKSYMLAVKYCEDMELAYEGCELKDGRYSLQILGGE